MERQTDAMKRKPETGPSCPRCKCADTRREANYGRAIKDGRWWCLKCGHLWWGFKADQIIKEETAIGIILQAGTTTYDVVWVGGSTSRYRYDAERPVHVATTNDLEGQGATVAHLKEEAAQARQERHTGARIKRGQVWPSR